MLVKEPSPSPSKASTPTGSTGDTRAPTKHVPSYRVNNDMERICIKCFRTRARRIAPPGRYVYVTKCRTLGLQPESNRVSNTCLCGMLTQYVTPVAHPRKCRRNSRLRMSTLVTQRVTQCRSSNLYLSQGIKFQANTPTGKIFLFYTCPGEKYSRGTQGGKGSAQSGSFTPRKSLTKIPAI